MFHLTDSEVTAIYEKLHDESIAARIAGKNDRADALKEAATMLHQARMKAADRRIAASSRRRQRQLQGAVR